MLNVRVRVRVCVHTESAAGGERDEEPLVDRFGGEDERDHVDRSTDYCRG